MRSPEIPKGALYAMNTLKKAGYETKSYRISIDSDQVDLT